MLRAYEENEKAKDKSDQSIGKAERIISEFEEVKIKMKIIEKEKTSLQETVSKVI